MKQHDHDFITKKWILELLPLHGMFMIKGYTKKRNNPMESIGL